MRSHWLSIRSLLVAAVAALLLTVAPLATAAEADPWALVGSGLSGGGPWDSNGGVALSADGNVVAVGSPADDTAATDAGIVRVFAQLSGGWSQLGAALPGIATSDFAGSSVALSDNGLVLAVGAPGYSSEMVPGPGPTGWVRVYAWSGTAWVQRGTTQYGRNDHDRFGYSVSLSNDGSVLAVGAPQRDAYANNAGQTAIFTWANGTWGETATINGAAASDRSGRSVSLNGDGSRVAIGAPYAGGSATGHVRVFGAGGGLWGQVGTTLNGEAWAEFGTSVSLSDDGMVLAIGAPWDATSDGRTFVYHYSGGAWTLRGSAIVGESDNDVSGRSVSLSGDGAVVAIGADDNDGNGVQAGHARVFRWSGSAWVQRGGDIDGSAGGSFAGRAVALNGDGERIAVNLPGANSNVGLVRVYSHVGITGRPSAPLGVSGVAAGTSVVVTWFAPVSDGGATITGYTATAGTGETCSVASVAPATPVTTCTISGLTSGLSLTFTVRATNAVGDGSTSAASATVTLAAPVATTPSAPVETTPAASVTPSGGTAPSAAPPAPVTKPTAAATRTGGNVTVAVAIPTASIGAKVVIMRKVGKRYVAVSTTTATGSALTIPLKVKGRPGSTQLRVLVGGKIVKSLKV